MNPAWRDEDLAARDAKIAANKFPMDGQPYFRPPYERPIDAWWWEPWLPFVVVFGALGLMLGALKMLIVLKIVVFVFVVSVVGICLGYAAYRLFDGGPP